MHGRIDTYVLQYFLKVGAKLTIVHDHIPVCKSVTTSSHNGNTHYRKSTRNNKYHSYIQLLTQ